MPKPRAIESFEFIQDQTLLGKYTVDSLIGSGWEGEVYRIREKETGVERAAKFFFPHRNLNNRTAKFYAKKLHKLRHCPMIIQYHSQETFYWEGEPVFVLISEFVQGESLTTFLKQRPGGKLHPYEGLRLLYALARGFEPIHNAREYHGDLHSDNVLVQRFGIDFDLKILDFFRWSAPRPENILDDVCFLIRLFYDSIGGEKVYAKLPPEVRNIACGLKKSLIAERFRNARLLREHLEEFSFESPKRRRRG